MIYCTTNFYQGEYKKKIIFGIQGGKGSFNEEAILILC